MLGLFGTLFFLAGAFFAFIGLSIAAIGTWILALLCALGSIENQLIKQRKLTAITTDQLEELIDIQKALAQKQNIPLTPAEKEAAEKAHIKSNPRFKNQA